MSSCVCLRPSDGLCARSFCHAIALIFLPKLYQNYDQANHADPRVQLRRDYDLDTITRESVSAELTSGPSLLSRDSLGALSHDSFA
jgi:hypothetical protein